jgi:hypothetical protein
VLSLDAEAVWLMLDELDAELLLLPDDPLCSWLRSFCNWASSDCSLDASWSGDETLSLLLDDEALLALDDELAEPVLAAALAGGGGGACCCWSVANSSSSTLASSVEVSLLLVELEALVTLEALLDVLEASVLLVPVLLSVDRPCRKLMFSSWKKAGGAAPVPTTVPPPLLLLLKSLLDEALLEVEPAAWLACCRCNCSCCHC